MFLAPAPEPAPRSGQFRSRISSQVDDRFLVEETNRRIEWSFLTLKRSPNPVEVEELQGEVEESTPEEMRSSKGVGKEKDLKHCMRINSNPVIFLHPSLFFLYVSKIVKSHCPILSLCP